MDQPAHKKLIDHQSQTFQLGMIVRIDGLGLKGELVKIDYNSGKCQIEIAGKLVKSTLSNINIIESKRVTKVNKKVDAPKNQIDKTTSIDLHGFTKLDAEEALVNLLNTALIQNTVRLEIIHGHGNGIIKKVVADFLSTSPYIDNFHLLENNTGTTIAFLK